MNEEARRVSVLGILPTAEQEMLQDILASSDCYDLICIRSPGFARAALLSRKPAIVITSDRFEGGQTWKDVLRETARAAVKPEVIVGSRLADDRLWAEVLNHGAFDLLEIPYRRSDVLYTISFAVRMHGQSRPARKRAASATQGILPTNDDVDDPVPFGLKLA